MWYQWRAGTDDYYLPKTKNNFIDFFLVWFKKWKKFVGSEFFLIFMWNLERSGRKMIVKLSYYVDRIQFEIGLWGRAERIKIAWELNEKINIYYNCFFCLFLKKEVNKNNVFFFRNFRNLVLFAQYCFLNCCLICTKARGFDKVLKTE